MKIEETPLELLLKRNLQRRRVEIESFKQFFALLHIEVSCDGDQRRTVLHKGIPERNEIRFRKRAHRFDGSGDRQRIRTAGKKRGEKTIRGLLLRFIERAYYFIENNLSFRFYVRGYK